MIRLGVNLDHVATLRNTRGEGSPDLLEILLLVCESGADGITIHLREDRRHIQDQDLFDIITHSPLPVNLEIACTNEMIEIALQSKPNTVCFVPEKREELTTEGGLNPLIVSKDLEYYLPRFKEDNIGVYLFVDPELKIIESCSKYMITGVELHTGNYARSFSNTKVCDKELEKLVTATEACNTSNLEVHAGHGLNHNNIRGMLQLPNLREVNVGHSLIADSLKVGLPEAIIQMKKLLE